MRSLWASSPSSRQRSGWPTSCRNSGSATPESTSWAHTFAMLRQFRSIHQARLVDLALPDEPASEQALVLVDLAEMAWVTVARARPAASRSRPKHSNRSVRCIRIVPLARSQWGLGYPRQRGPLRRPRRLAGPRFRTPARPLRHEGLLA